MSDEEIARSSTGSRGRAAAVRTTGCGCIDVIDALEAELAGRYKNGLEPSLERLQ